MAPSPTAPAAVEPGVFDWFRERLRLVGQDVSEAWNEEQHGPTVAAFSTDAKAQRLFAYQSATAPGSILLSDSLPDADATKVLYFVKVEEAVLTADTIQDVVHCGQCSMVSPTESLLGTVQGVLGPSLLSNSEWSDTMQREFAGRLQKVMTELTDAVQGAKGKTVLYTPQDDLDNVQEVARDQERVKLLETRMIHWTRQVKMVARQHEGGVTRTSPLDELAFWRARLADLAGIHDQLRSSGVKRVEAVLEATRSPYLAPFQKLEAAIEHGVALATDNVKYLGILEAPSTALSKCLPKDVPGKLPVMLHCIRAIWTLCAYYSDPEKLVELLRQIAGQVIVCCTAAIPVTDLLNGDVTAGLVVLQESLDACEAWRGLFHQTKAKIAASKAAPWTFEDAHVFAHTNAFMQRCRDLVALAAAQQQHAPRKSMPVFRGSVGLEITNSIKGIQTSFQTLLDPLKHLSYSILDVNTNVWFDDFRVFSFGVRDLDLLLCNVIEYAYDNTTSPVGYIELTEVFNSIMVTPVAKQGIARNTANMYALLLREFESVRKQFDAIRKYPPVSPVSPALGLRATMASGLLIRLEKVWSLLQAVRDVIPALPVYEEVAQVYAATVAGIEQYLTNVHNEWWVGIAADLQNHLDAGLVVHHKNSGGLLANSLHNMVGDALLEVPIWMRLARPVPNVAQELVKMADKLRVPVASVTGIVRTYNKALGSLTREERRLFHDRMRQVDRRVMPGINKLTWMRPKPALDSYCREALWYCKEVSQSVEDFQKCRQRIDAAISVVQELNFFALERKMLYEQEAFVRVQRKQHEQVRDTIQEKHEIVKESLERMHTFFAQDSSEVQRYWRHYVKKVDLQMESALRTAVKRSMAEMARTFTGVRNQEPAALFKVNLVLEQNGRVELAPTIQELFNMIHGTSREMVSITSCIPRLVIAQQQQPQQTTPREPAEEQREGEVPVEAEEKPEEKVQQSYYEVLSAEEDTTLRFVMLITNAISGIIERIQTLLIYWEKKYKHVWDQDKEAILWRYDKANKPLSAFESDIEKYGRMSEEILAENARESVRFLSIENTPLQKGLVSHCRIWASRLQNLLHTSAQRELGALHSHMKAMAEAMQKPITDMRSLSDAMALLQKLQDESTAFEGRFEPLELRYAALARFEVIISDQETEDLEDLQPALSEHSDAVTAFEKVVEEHQAEQLQLLRTAIAAFAEDTYQKLDVFRRTAPYSQQSWTPASAMEFLQGAKADVEAHHTTLNELNFGVKLLEAAVVPVADMQKHEEETLHLIQTWTAVSEWNEGYSAVRDVTFAELQLQSLQAMGSRIANNLKLEHVDSWPVWQDVHTAVAAFNSTLPVAKVMQSITIRPRHWTALAAKIGQQIDPSARRLVLQDLVDLKFRDHQVYVTGKLATEAQEQHDLEMQLQGLQSAREEVHVDMSDESGMWMLTDHTQAMHLLDRQAAELAHIRQSEHERIFTNTIRAQDEALRSIAHTIDLIEQVQHHWENLEAIYGNPQHACAQLDQQRVAHVGATDQLRKCMTPFSQASSIDQACKLAAFQSDMQALNRRLAIIRAELATFLEDKRRVFPRFHFLSSEDMFEVYGRIDKNVHAIQEHMHKIFAGARKLEIRPAVGDKNHGMVVAGMYSGKREYLPFPVPIPINGPVEIWMGRVEYAMQTTVQGRIMQVLKDARKVKLEPWVLGNQLQFLILVLQINWTAGVEEALGHAGSPLGALQHLRESTNIAQLQPLLRMASGHLSALNRHKVEILLVVAVQHMHATERIHDCNDKVQRTLLWNSMIRFYLTRLQDGILVKQGMATFNYGSEYLGDVQRLVITPAIERSAMALTTAMFMNTMGTVSGAVSTGKTGIIKELGFQLGRQVVIMNCSEGINQHRTARVMLGAAQSGAWALFDNINCLPANVLSVFAADVGSLLLAMKNKESHVTFQGQNIKLAATAAFMSTMNPSFAVMSALPDNLQSQMWPVAMGSPDAALIAESVLLCFGFQNSKVVAKQLAAIRQLILSIMPQRPHYLFGLRSFIFPAIQTAGNYNASLGKHANISESESLRRAIVENCQHRMVAEDLPLFNTLLREVFARGHGPHTHSQSLNRMHHPGSLRNHLQRGSIAQGQVQRGSMIAGVQRGSLVAGVQRNALKSEAQPRATEERSTRSTEDMQHASRSSLAAGLQRSALGTSPQQSAMSDRQSMQGTEDLPAAPAKGSIRMSINRSALKVNAGRRSSLSDQQSMRGTEDVASPQRSSGDQQAQGSGRVSAEASQASLHGEADVQAALATKPKKRVSKAASKPKVMSAEELAAEQAAVQAKEEAAAVHKAVEDEMKTRGLQVTQSQVKKIAHLLEVKAAKRCNMLYGPSGSGKTTAWQCAEGVMQRLHDTFPSNPAYNRVQRNVIHPTSLSFDELYGSFDKDGEWQDGIFPVILREANTDELSQQHWVVFDGPVEPYWPKLLSTLLDESRLLLLPSGHVMAAKDEISIFIETDDLSHAAPSTISRTYLTYFNTAEVGWRFVWKSWLAARVNASIADYLSSHAEQQIEASLEAIDACKQEGHHPLPTGSLTCIQNVTRLLAATDKFGNRPVEMDLIQMWLSFALIWGIGAVISANGRPVFNEHLRRAIPLLPAENSLFDYFADLKTGQWIRWINLMPAFEPPRAEDMHKLPVVVPTASTTSSGTLSRIFLQHGANVIVMGPVGSGKSVLTNYVLETLPRTYASCAICCTSLTTSKEVQMSIEHHLEKREKGVWGPPSGKRQLIAFVDDLNIPKETATGTIPAVEMLTGFADTASWYDRHTAEVKRIKHTQLFGALTPHAGQKAQGCLRIMAKCAIVQKLQPNEAGYINIFKSLLPSVLDSNPSFKDSLIAAMITVFNNIKAQLPVEPTSDPYYFGVGHIAGVATGLFRVSEHEAESQASILRLWCHEVLRAMGSQCVTVDQHRICDIMDQQLQSSFSTSWLQLFATENHCPPHAALPGPDGKQGPYEAVMHPSAVEAILTRKAQEQHTHIDHSPAGIILFREDVDHISRLFYLLEQQHRHLILLNKFGSSSKDLAVKAGVISDCQVHLIDINMPDKTYKALMLATYINAAKDQRAMLLYDDNVTADRHNDASHLITTGGLPSWISEDQVHQIIQATEPACEAAGKHDTPSSHFRFLSHKVQENVNVVLCMGTGSEQLSQFYQAYPGCIRYTTINAVNRFLPETLSEMASRELEGDCLAFEGQREIISKAIAIIHRTAVMHANEAAKVSPLPIPLSTFNVRGLVQTFRTILHTKSKETDSKRDKLQLALRKVIEAREAEVQEAADVQHKTHLVAQAVAAQNEQLFRTAQQRRSVDELQQQAAKMQEKQDAHASRAQELQDSTSKALATADAFVQSARLQLQQMRPELMDQLRGLQTLPMQVEAVSLAVLVLLKRPASRDAAKAQLADPQLMATLLESDKSGVDDVMTSKLTRSLSSPGLTPEALAAYPAAFVLYNFLQALREYGQVSTSVRPDQARVEQLQASVTQLQAAAAKNAAQLAELKEALETLREEQQRLHQHKTDLEASLAACIANHDEAVASMPRLAKAYEGWDETLRDLESHATALPGDTLLASAFLAYAGFFESKRRNALKVKWSQRIQELGLAISPDYSLPMLLSTPAHVQGWKRPGLSPDEASIDSAALVLCSPTWPFIIDSQLCAEEWLEKLHEGQKLHTVELESEDYLAQLKTCIKSGDLVLLKGMGSHVDPRIERLVKKELSVKKGVSKVLIDGESMEMHESFRMYIMAPQGRVSLSDTINGKVVVLNHVMSHTEAQVHLSDLVLQQERHDSYQIREEKIEQLTKGLLSKEEEEAHLLALLPKSPGLVSHNHTVVHILDELHAAMIERRKEVQDMEKNLKALTELTPIQSQCVQRAAMLIESLDELEKVGGVESCQVDHVKLLRSSLLHGHELADMSKDERMGAVIEEHTTHVLTTSSRSFDRHHRLLIALHIAMLAAQQQSKLAIDEWHVCVGSKAGAVQPAAMGAGPAWLPKDTWVGLHRLAAMPSTQVVAQALIAQPDAWNAWWTSSDPEKTPLPHGTSVTLTPFQELVFVRVLRPSRFKQAVKVFVALTLGVKFAAAAESTSAVAQILADSQPEIPSLIMHGPNSVTPFMQSLDPLAKGKPIVRMPMGRDRERAVEEAIRQAAVKGQWIHIINLHLAPQWLAGLSHFIRSVADSQPHPEFRMWLSSAGTQQLSIDLRRSCLVAGFERPQGIKQNMEMLLSAIMRKGSIQSLGKLQAAYPRIFYACGFLHSILVMHCQMEVSTYNYRLRDFLGLDAALRLLLEGQVNVPWPQIQVLMADITHGSRMPDPRDMHYLHTLVHQLVNENVMSQANMPLAPVPQYFVPHENTLAGLKQHIEALPDLDTLEAYWNHVNSILPHEKRDSDHLLHQLVELHEVHFPDLAADSAAEAPSLSAARDVARDILHQLAEVSKMIASADHNHKSILAAVLLQEMQLFWGMWELVRDTCSELLAPNSHMTGDLGRVARSLAANKVPQSWAKGTAHAGSDLRAWANLIQAHIVLLSCWLKGHQPTVIALPEFKRPGALLTAVLQEIAYSQGEVVQHMYFEASQIDDESSRPEPGSVHIKGLSLDGAAWCPTTHHLCDPLPSQPSMRMPVMALKPAVLQPNERTTGHCPLYQREAKDGNGHRTPIASILLPVGPNNAHNRLLHGTALFLSPP